MHTISSIEQLKDVVENNPTVVVDLYADWCSPCQQMLPVVEELSNEVNVPFYKVNIDIIPEAKEFTGAKAIPMLLVYKEGRKREFAFGVTPKDTVKNKIERVMRY
jgi:thioredoxin